MPLIDKSTYKKPPFRQFNGFLQTIVPAMFRRVDWAYQGAKRIELEDGDFIDYCYKYQASKKLVVLTHGLEGNAFRHYVVGTAHHFFEQGWDVLAWNCRGCGFEINRLPRLYHHGDIDGLDGVMNHILSTTDYEEIVLVGFSMGGSINSKYVGVKGKNIDPRIKASINFSTPCQIEESIKSLEKWQNKLFKKLFLTRLKHRIGLKVKQFPNWVDMTKFDEIKTWRDFDNWFTVPMTGLDSPEAFYKVASCENYMADAAIPLLVVNALNDPIIPESCSPTALASTHPNIFVEQPKKGGHVGFSTQTKALSWMELRTMSFVSNFE